MASEKAKKIMIRLNETIVNSFMWLEPKQKQGRPTGLTTEEVFQQR